MIQLWHEDGCCCGAHNHEHEHNHQANNDLTSLFISDDDAVLELEDEITGERLNFVLADEFEFEGKNYGVLVHVTDDEEPSYTIAALTEDDNGEFFVETLTEAEETKVFAEYDRILAETAAEEEAD